MENCNSCKKRDLYKCFPSYENKCDQFEAYESKEKNKNIRIILSTKEIINICLLEEEYRNFMHQYITLKNPIFLQEKSINLNHIIYIEEF